nr:hypothetical protein [Methanoregulaceae archaeon]
FFKANRYKEIFYPVIYKWQDILFFYLAFLGRSLVSSMALIAGGMRSFYRERWLTKGATMPMSGTITAGKTSNITTVTATSPPGMRSLIPTAFPQVPCFNPVTGTPGGDFHS